MEKKTPDRYPRTPIELKNANVEAIAALLTDYADGLFKARFHALSKEEASRMCVGGGDTPDAFAQDAVLKASREWKPDRAHALNFTDYTKLILKRKVDSLWGVTRKRRYELFDGDMHSAPRELLIAEGDPRIEALIALALAGKDRILKGYIRIVLRSEGRVPKPSEAAHILKTTPQRIGASLGALRKAARSLGLDLPPEVLRRRAAAAITDVHHDALRPEAVAFAVGLPESKVRAYRQGVGNWIRRQKASAGMEPKSEPEAQVVVESEEVCARCGSSNFTHGVCCGCGAESWWAHCANPNEAHRGCE